MAKHSDEPVLLEGIIGKSVVSKFEGELRTSDAGASLLGAIDRRTGLTERLCARLTDPRDPSRIEHSYLELLRQRVFSIALGYPDGNDSARVGHDPMLKLACGRQPAAGRSLASQPTLSRFEHGVSGREVIGLTRGLEDFVIDRLGRRYRRARLVTIDLDGTVDPTHGQQPFAFFNGHYDTWCYFPLLGFLSIDDHPEQHLFHARLRPGVAKEARGTLALLRRTVANLHRAFKKARIRVRLDAGFACPQLFEISAAATTSTSEEWLHALEVQHLLKREGIAHVVSCQPCSAPRLRDRLDVRGVARVRGGTWATHIAVDD